MLRIIKKLQHALRERATYKRTRDEIAHMPRDIALDLGIFRGDAEKIAYKAAWS
jgi:uncharacterized protein YjiS (DUF1127 family)